jgi:Trypsin-co-occurring domain 1
MPIVQSTHKVSGQEVKINIEMDRAPAQADPYGPTRGAGERVIESARDYFADGMMLARHCAVSIVENLKGLSKASRPDEFEVQLAIKLDAEAGAIPAIPGG